MFSVEFVCVIIFTGFLILDIFQSNSYLFLKGQNEIIPWIGIIRVKSGKHRPDAVTRSILVGKRLAVANAIDIAKIRNSTLRKRTRVMFYTNNEPWYCGIINYVLHPEYYDHVLNTIALIRLSCTEDSHWNPVIWPTDESVPETAYIIGLTDSDQRIHQDSYRVEAVNASECDDFYNKEELNYKSLQPTRCVCFKALSSEKPCVIDAGMALVIKLEDSYILKGISTHGPGCSLPSRFIPFFPYIPWIKPQLSRMRSMRKPKNFRRTNDEYEQGMEEPYEDMDKLILSKIDNNTIVMRPSLAYVKEQVYGKCDPIDGVMMYREYGTIKAPKQTAVGIYSVSLYDIFFRKLTCVMVTVICNKRSETKFWFDTGFHQEDIDNYIKIIPIPQRNKTKDPKILYVKDTHERYRMIKTINLDFKFEFTDEAKMDLEFYGRNDSKIPKFTFDNFSLRPKNKTLEGTSDGKNTKSLRNKQNNETFNDDNSFYFF